MAKEKDLVVFLPVQAETIRILVLGRHWKTGLEMLDEVLHSQSTTTLRNVFASFKPNLGEFHNCSGAAHS